MKMNRQQKKAFAFYTEMIENDNVHISWIHDDYDDVTVYEDVNGDIVCVQWNANNEMVDIWLE